MILITHDRSLMELVADRLWLAADGGVKPFDGDMDAYARYVLDRARRSLRAPTQVEAPAAPKAAPPAPAKQAMPAGPLKRRLDAAETTLARLTRDLEALDAELADPAIYVSNPTRAADLTRRREAAQAKVDAAESEWLTLSEQYEHAVAA